MAKTIYEKLKEALGREPTHAELTQDVRRILEEAKRERARLRNRKKTIAAVNGFYASTERGAKIHVTKQKGLYL